MFEIILDTETTGLSIKENHKILGIDNILTPSRRNGVYSMLNYIKKYAKSYMLNN